MALTRALAIVGGLPVAVLDGSGNPDGFGLEKCPPKPGGRPSRLAWRF